MVQKELQDITLCLAAIKSYEYIINIFDFLRIATTLPMY